MYWQLALTLIAIAGGVWAMIRLEARERKQHMQDLADIVQRELDDNCLGDESSHVKPLHDERGRLIGFMRESCNKSGN